MSEELKDLVARFEAAVVAEQQYDAFLERSEQSWISKARLAQADRLREMVNQTRSALLNFGG